MKLLTLLILALSLPVMSACIKDKDTASQDPTAAVEISHAYGFATMPGAATGAAFMRIENTDKENDTLISATSDVAEITEIHQNLIDPDDGVMMMRKMKELDIPAKSEVVLEPKGYHIMFIKLKEPLTINSTVQMTLMFEKAGEKIVTATIIAPGTAPNYSDDKDHGHSH